MTANQKLNKAVAGSETMLGIVDADSMKASELMALRRAKLHDLARCEAWTAIGTNRELAYATHGAMRFFGKFPPPVAAHLIETYAPVDGLVVDPMSGSGTTAVECLLRGRECQAFDVNPLMVLLARVKTTPVDASVSERAIDLIAKKFRPVDFEKAFGATLIGLRNRDHWFLPETLDGLAGLKSLIDAVKSKEVRDLLTISMLAIVRKVSRATSQQGRLFLDAKSAQKDVLPAFLKRAREIASAVSQLPLPAAPIKIEQKSILNDDPAAGQNADLLILHPPYFNSYKYSGVTSLETFWMGVDHAEIRSREVKEFFKIGKAENHAIYVEDMVTALRNAVARTKPGGSIGFMVGDTVIKSEYIPVTRKILDAAYDGTWSIERVALRVPRYTEASWAASQRRTGGLVGISLSDFVIVLTKNA